MVMRRSDSDLSKVPLYYDSNTGQVYTETTLSAKSGKRRGSRTLPRLRDVRQRSGGQGVPTLERLSIQTVMDNVYNILPETLENMPWTVRRRIWEAREVLSHDAKFHLWKVLIQSQFTSSLADPSLSYRRMCKEDTRHEPLRPLPDYLSTINSSSTSWLTALTLSKINFPRRDLYQLSKLQNLVALDICAPPDHLSTLTADPFSRATDAIPQSLIDNTVLRHFATHADVASAFQSLRVFILRGFRDVTSDCLQHLNSFPRLSLFGVQNCGLGQNASRLRDDEARARSHGWTTEDERGLLGQLRHEIEMSHTWDGMLKACVEVTAVFAGRDVGPDDATTDLAKPKTADRAERSKSAEPPRTAGACQPEITLAAWRESIRQQDLLRQRRAGQQASSDDVDPPRLQPDPPLLNFKIGPTCSDLIFSTPMVFFRCMHGHIEEAKDRATVQRSESKNRRPSGPGETRAAKRPKLRAGRSVRLTEWFEIQGVGRRLSSIELEKA